MAFGVSVTDYANVEGSVGYIINIDISSLLFDTVTAIQAQVATDDTPAPVTMEVPLSTLHGYMNSSTAPDLAFNYTSGTISIFFKTSVYAYDAATRFIMFGYRLPQKANISNDLLDIPNKDLELCKAYAIKYAWEMKRGSKPESSILEKIRIEEKRVRDE